MRKRGPAIIAHGPSVQFRVGSIGGRVAFSRFRRGLTQKQLGELLGVSRTTIAQYERDAIEPSVSQIVKLAEHLHRSPEYLAFGRQGISTGGSGSDEIVALTEITAAPQGDSETGTYGLPAKLADQFGIDEENAKIYVLSHEAPEFAYAAGDRVIVNLLAEIVPDHQNYLMRTANGIDVARVPPRFSSNETMVDLIGSDGRSYRIALEELTILGAVVGSIRRK